uniref:Telomere-binding protein 1 n=1 Tax=Oryza barthii TaxID=65489 RepID=A0A0D3FC33_9ORYZ
MRKPTSNQPLCPKTISSHHQKKKEKKEKKKQQETQGKSSLLLFHGVFLLQSFPLSLSSSSSLRLPLAAIPPPRPLFSNLLEPSPIPHKPSCSDLNAGGEALHFVGVDGSSQTTSSQMSGWGVEHTINHNLSFLRAKRYTTTSRLRFQRMSSCQILSVLMGLTNDEFFPFQKHRIEHFVLVVSCIRMSFGIGSMFTKSCLFDAEKYGACFIYFPLLSLNTFPSVKDKTWCCRRGWTMDPMAIVLPLSHVKRSTRIRKKQMYALDLLATAAEKLLADQDNLSSGPNINETPEGYVTSMKPVKAEQFDEAFPLRSVAVKKDDCKGCTVGCAGICGFLRQANMCLAENSSTQNLADSVLESLTAKPDVLAKDSFVSSKKSCRLGFGLGTIPEYGSVGVCQPWSTRSAEVKQVHRARPTAIRSQEDSDAAALCALVETMDLDTKPLAEASSGSNSGVHICGHDRGHNSHPSCLAKVQHAADRDDDENSSGCVHPSTSGNNRGYIPHYIGDRRIRRLFASRLRKAARNRICGEMSCKGNKLSLCEKKMPTTRRRVQQTTLKRKRLAQLYSEKSSDEVKLTIKSFNIPELLIEIPENATVGSLKKTVSDAVTTIIERGLRVGILLQGKNIQNDNKTLRQAGICRGKKLDDIGFTLECEAGQDSHPGVIVPEEMDFVGASVMDKSATVKCEEPAENQQLMQDFPGCSLSDPGSVDYPVEWSTQETSASSQAIVPFADPNSLVLANVPLSRSKRPDFGQRRIRRPFTVAEVELLVEAVEHLGTGRWRDVKFRAFENVHHRTYVDLKDKWKTLVHTASIAPQQRRGAPVPQELLDRVLAAQAYWSEQQAKLHGDPPVPEICPT